MVLSREKCNRAPRGLTSGRSRRKDLLLRASPRWWRSEGFDPARYDDSRPDAPKWTESRTIEGKSWKLSGAAPLAVVTRPAPGATRLVLRMAADKDPALAGVHVELYYELYEGHAALRKWISSCGRGCY